MDDWAKAGGGGEWSRRRFLLQTATFSALALLGSPRRRNCTQTAPIFFAVNGYRASR